MPLVDQRRRVAELQRFGGLGIGIEHGSERGLERSQPGLERHVRFGPLAEDRTADLFGAGGAHSTLGAVEFQAGLLERQPAIVQQRANFALGIANHVLIDHAVDPARLHQALLNLLDNALRYSPSDSTIEVNLELRDRWCLIGVRDHGPGLSTSDQKLMFQRFYRGDPSRTRASGGGTGLGLAIAHAVVTEQGGRLTLVSSPQQGTVATVALPVQAAPDQDADRAGLLVGS